MAAGTVEVVLALRAVTLGGACRTFEDGSKGSIPVGKQADLVMWGENPLTAAPEFRSSS